MMVSGPKPGEIWRGGGQKLRRATSVTCPAENGATLRQWVLLGPNRRKNDQPAGTIGWFGDDFVVRYWYRTGQTGAAT